MPCLARAGWEASKSYSGGGQYFLDNCIDVPQFNFQCPASLSSFPQSGEVIHRQGYSNSDFVVWRPSNGMWYFKNGEMPHTRWGGSGDIPMRADYDGDGYNDIV